MSILPHLEKLKDANIQSAIQAEVRANLVQMVCSTRVQTGLNNSRSRCNDMLLNTYFNSLVFVKYSALRDLFRSSHSRITDKLNSEEVSKPVFLDNKYWPAYFT